MTLSKERRQHLRERISEARSGQSFGSVTPWDDIEALLDLADERDRYRALLIVAASVLSEDGDTTEADARALYQRITFALEGNDGD